MSFDLKKLGALASKNKYVLLVLVLGIVLLLLPAAEQSAVSAPAEAVSEEEHIAAFLSLMEGVGDAEVLLGEDGAVVLCSGAEKAEVRLGVTNAVSAYTGLGSDKIRVIKMK